MSGFPPAVVRTLITARSHCAGQNDNPPGSLDPLLVGSHNELALFSPRSHLQGQVYPQILAAAASRTRQVCPRHSHHPPLIQFSNIRAIATHYLLDLQPVSYCPLTWDAKELWHPRIVYATFRDAIALEKLMQVTPTWAVARMYPFPSFSLKRAHLFLLFVSQSRHTCFGTRPVPSSIPMTFLPIINMSVPNPRLPAQQAVLPLPISSSHIEYPPFVTFVK